MINENNLIWSILDALDEGIYFSDKKRLITYWNKAAEEITGYQGREVLSRSCGDDILNHVDTEGKSLCNEDCPLCVTLETGEVFQREAFLHKKDGSREKVKIKVAPVFGANKEIIGAVEIFRPIKS